MAETLAVRGFGLVLSVGDGAVSETFTPILEAIDFEYPDEDVEEIDVTHHQSPNRRREYLASFINNGESTFKCNWVPASASHLLIQALKVAGTVRHWRVAFPSSPVVTHQFSAFVKKAKPGSPIDGQLILEVTLRATGDITVV